jgi:hypothetical protein
MPWMKAVLKLSDRKILQNWAEEFNFCLAFSQDNDIMT